MDERRALGNELDEIQQQMKDLEILYEQYFAGVQKREPQLGRKNLSRRIRQYNNRRIVWTDLKFRHQGLASRFMSYCQYWDRILRLMDEGKYHRHTAKLNTQTAPSPPNQPDSDGSNGEATRLQQALSDAREACGIEGAAPSAEKIAAFLDAQREKIRQRYGDKAVAFSIDTSDGKPRIKVSLKK